MSKKLRKSANFAMPNLPRNVNLGAKIGAGLGLASGIGIGESDQERESTGIGGRLSKIVGKTALGAGVGAGAGYGYDKFKSSTPVNTNSLNQKAEEVLNKPDLSSNAAQPPAPDKSIQQARSDAQAQKWKAYENRPQPAPAPTPAKPSKFKEAYDFLNRDIKDPELQRDLYRGYVSTRRNLGLYNKTMKDSANFQDPATIQRLIQHGSTYITPDKGGITLAQAMQQKSGKPKKEKKTSMSVKEIQTMIDSGKPEGKYFSKGLRQSVNFAKRHGRTADFFLDRFRGRGILEQAGRYISDPISNTLKNKASDIRGGSAGGLLKRMTSMLPNDAGQEARASLGKANALQGAGDWFGSKQGAETTAIGTGVAVGGGLLAAGMAMRKKPPALEEEVQ